MDPVDQKRYINNQRQDWNRVAPAWEKWDQYLDHNLSFVSYRMVGDARLRSGHRVLDLGCGTGFPALLAAHAVGSRGSVVGLDLSEGMIAVARHKAAALGLTNIMFEVDDVTVLPFHEYSFDAVISRFCLMFLPDIPAAVTEIGRVLRSGGYITAAVWSLPDKNPFISIPMQVIKRFIDLPPPDPAQPGIFRLARPGDLLRMLEQEGLEGIEDNEVKSESLFKSPEEYLANIEDLAAPLQELFARLTPTQRDEAESEIKRLVNQYRRGDKIVLPMAFRIITGRKP